MSTPRSSLLCGLALAAFALVALPLRAAVPGQVDFQGLLLDSGGQKVNGAVALVFTLYDSETGGNALWTETHNGVQVVDGVYGLTLGTTTPLGDGVLSGGSVFLEIKVDGETLSPRRQLLAVPYAIRAQNAENLGGTSSAFFTQIVQHFDFDGGPPANDDPREGTADVDGDGLANFIDPDNDNDGLSDTQELARGSDINLVTPIVSGFAPSQPVGGVAQTITVQGSSFEAGMSVAFGAEHPTPQNVTPTSFQVSVGPQPYGSVSVVVTRTNGEHDSKDLVFRGRLVFTSSPMTGGFGGSAGADALCATRAAALGLTGTYLAWIGDATTNPATRFLHDDVRYERPDGTVIADSWADLTDGSLDAVTSNGVTGVWTGVLADGTTGPNHCQNWTSSSATDLGLRGVATVNDSRWTNYESVACSLSQPVYCFQQ